MMAVLNKEYKETSGIFLIHLFLMLQGIKAVLAIRVFVHFMIKDLEVGLNRIFKFPFEKRSHYDSVSYKAKK